MAEGSTVIDEGFEFSAPRFFDFVNGETEEEAQQAQLWFENAISYAPSPFMPKIKAHRSVKLESMCDFGEDQGQKTSESSEVIKPNCTNESKPEEELKSSESKKTEANQSEATKEEETSLIKAVSASEEIINENKEKSIRREESKSGVEDIVSSKMEMSDGKCKITSSELVDSKACTPKPPTNSLRGNTLTGSKKQQTAKKIASAIKNVSALKPKGLLSSGAKSNLSANVKRETKVNKPVGTPSLAQETKVNKPVGTPSLAQENQAIKRQKLESGKSRQILNPKLPSLPHKSKLGLASGSKCSSVNTNNANKEDRKMYVREPAPFVSMAEMMRKFQSSTRELSLPHSTLSHDDAASVVQRPKLTLTRPKEPEFITAQRVRPMKVKSSAEIEEEIMAKIPKFKARPLNKKILEAPTLPPLPKTRPQLPAFQEFHLETMTRANQNAECASIASTETSRSSQWKPHLTAPRSPVLQTTLRARPVTVKSSIELELEELERAPKFKARPLNRKIFESKGELGIFCNLKKEVTRPQEFHFATSERIPPPAAVVDMFDKLSLNSEPRHDNPIPKNTKRNPFHLKTEERGAEKERRFRLEVMQKAWEDELARQHKANPYPYTTDYPVIPPKPEPKQCTRPEPFQLESLVRHEEEMRREEEERRRKEREEAEMRKFKAQPVLKEDPIPVPEKVRKPLTQVEEFNHHVVHRAVERAEFDQKVREKEMMYKRYREESEAARMMEEEKALKQMRRTLVPHARPLPKFDNPFRPQKSSQMPTKAKSPKLRVQQRRRKVGGELSAATQMR